MTFSVDSMAHRASMAVSFCAGVHARKEWRETLPIENAVTGHNLEDRSAEVYEVGANMAAGRSVCKGSIRLW